MRSFYVVWSLTCLVLVQAAGRPVVTTQAVVPASSSLSPLSSLSSSTGAARPIYQTAALSSSDRPTSVTVSSSSSKAVVGRPGITTSAVLAAASRPPTSSLGSSSALPRTVSSVSRSVRAGASASAVPSPSAFASTLQGKVLYGYQGMVRDRRQLYSLDIQRWPWYERHDSI